MEPEDKTITLDTYDPDRCFSVTMDNQDRCVLQAIGDWSDTCRTEGYSLREWAYALNSICHAVTITDLLALIEELYEDQRQVRTDLILDNRVRDAIEEYEGLRPK